MKKMNLQDYLLNKKKFESQKPVYRTLCTTCLHPEFSCYCENIETFDPMVRFVILIHPIEYHRRIATGRMSHLILKNSCLIRGHDFTRHEKVNALIDDPRNENIILYPGFNSLNLTDASEEQKNILAPRNKNLNIFVIDGTWATARQMMRESLNLRALKKVCFTPLKPSEFKVRKQPKSYCLSTIEAIHQLLEISGATFGFPVESRQHDLLLKNFNQMVQRQIDWVENYPQITT